VNVARRRLLLLAVAAPLALADLGQEAGEPVYGHPRSLVYVAGALALAALLVAFVPRVPSPALSVAAGVAVAGDAGNLVAALLWRGGVPNPIVAGDLAFNLADAFAVLGAFALVFGATLFALRNRTLLHQRV
jgi:hypothetical protein